MAEFNVTKAKEFVALHRKKRDLDAQLKAVGVELDALEHELSDEFVRHGMQNITVAGATVFIARQIWASTASGQAEPLAAALTALGLADLAKVTVNSNTLSSYVREQPTGADDMPVLPETLVGLVNVREVFSIRVNEK